MEDNISQTEGGSYPIKRERIYRIISEKVRWEATFNEYAKRPEILH